MKCYLHSIIGSRNPVHAALADGVRADSDVFLELVQIGELGGAPVHLQQTDGRMAAKFRFRYMQP